MDENKWSRRSVIGAGIIGVLGGAGAVAAASQTESATWLFTIFGAERGDAPVSVEQISTFPPGRTVRDVELLLTAERVTTVDVMVEIDSEDEPDDGWPINEGLEFAEDEQKVIELSFDETYSNVDDNDLLITIEETGLE